MRKRISSIVSTFEQAKNNITTEEATKTALIMPFLAALDYNVFNPLEVVPEIVADIGEKKGEKIDYAVKNGDETLMLIECKRCTQPLVNSNISQIFRYFGACRIKMGVRLAVLTNGLEYLFFTDLENGNVLDITPFFKFNLLDHDEQNILELQQFSKDNFNIDKIVENADNMKRRSAVESVLEGYFSKPTDNFIKCVLTDLDFQTMKTQSVITTYSDIIKDAFNKIIREKVNNVIKDALKQNQAEATDSISPPAPKTPVSLERRKPLQSENDALSIISNNLTDIINSDRISLRVVNRFSSVIIDNNRNKLIAKLYFLNDKTKKIYIFDENNQENEISLDIIDVPSILNYIENIKKAVLFHDKK
jgi:hypothetical protein